MSEYAAFYDASAETWRVIRKDAGDGYWIIEVPDAGTFDSASAIAALLNGRES